MARVEWDHTVLPATHIVVAANGASRG